VKFIIGIFILFFIGCDKKSSNSTKKVYISDVIQEENQIIRLDDLEFIKNGNKLEYNFDKPKVLLFFDNSKSSKNQLLELQNIKYYKANKIANYFDIKIFPTIVIINKNKTKKYEGFIPYEVLKYEIKE
jgi:hypothetical protein